MINAEDLVLRSDVDYTMPSPPSSELTKVMWWNLGCSSTLLLSEMSTERRPNFSPESAWQNLRSIIQTDFEPDILVLGEYCPADFDHPTYEVLAGHYPYIHRVVRSNPNFRKRNGLRVFSKYPLTVKEELLLTDGGFASNFLENLCPGSINTNDDIWSRHQSILEVDRPSGVFTLAPVHFANPWRVINSCLNPFAALAEIYSGDKNVNYLQALDLLSVLDDSLPLLVIGDFNAPKRGGWFLDSNTYSALKENWGGSLIKSSSPTYLDKTGKFPDSSIDHAFSIQLDKEYGEVLPLSGSDHLPIMVGF
jgi:hypothetical protein